MRLFEGSYPIKELGRVDYMLHLNVCSKSCMSQIHVVFEGPYLIKELFWAIYYS